MTHARVLAERLIPGEGLLWEAARLISANILLALCAQIAFPLPWSPVPFTGQTFGVLLVAVVLGARRAAIVTSLYLLEGAIGLPVFQPFGAPGAARLLGPTAGYLWSYPLVSFITGWLAERLDWTERSFAGVAPLGGAILLGHAMILVSGWAWLANVMQMGWPQAFAAGVAPFLLDALMKTVLVIAAAQGISRIRRAA